MATDLEGRNTGIKDGIVITDIPGSAVEKLAGSSFIILETLHDITFEYQYDENSEHEDNLVTFSVSEYFIDVSESRKTTYTETYEISFESSGELVLDLDSDEIKITPKNLTGELIKLIEETIDEPDQNLNLERGGGAILKKVEKDTGEVMGEGVSLLEAHKNINNINLIKLILQSNLNIQLKRQLIIAIINYYE